jgi:uncharacterized protein (DUF433 family)
MNQVFQMERRGADILPIVTGDNGVMLIAGTRIPIDTVIEAFDQGATAEEIVQQYATLALADVYQLIAHYLRHQPELKDYLERRRAQAGQIRRENESRAKPEGIRRRLLSRQRTL